METFLTKHADLITASLSCFDRIIFKGYLPLGYESAMDGWLSQRGILLKDFGRFVKRQADRLQQHARAVAEQTGRPLRYLGGRQNKEKLVDQILKDHPIQAGLIAVLSAVANGSTDPTRLPRFVHNVAITDPVIVPQLINVPVV